MEKKGLGKWIDDLWEMGQKMLGTFVRQDPLFKLFNKAIGILDDIRKGIVELIEKVEDL